MSATLHIISSGSIGNNYILDCNGEKLILELGLPWKQVLRGLDYKMEGIVGCCVSHQHSDHSFSIPNALSYGLKVFAPPSVCEIYPKCKMVKHMCKYQIGNFWILPLKVPHGDCECFAYHINLPDGQTLLFATDLQEFPYKLSGVNTLMIEVNNCDETVLNNLCDGANINSRPDNHLSLEKALEATRRLYNPKLNKVIALHLSDGNSDENLIKRRFRDELGINIFIAESGMNVCLDEDF